MAVKDKLELERLLSILEDLESMYRHSDISEDTYREMKKTYKSKISKLQDRIMDVSDDDLDDLSAISASFAKDISDNVNDVLKDTMKILKEQLKTVGVEDESRKFKKEETAHIHLEGEGNLVLKCKLERGKIHVRGGSVHSVTVVSEKQVQSESALGAQRQLQDISLGIRHKHKKDCEEIIIEPDCPRPASIDLLVKIPDRLLSKCILNIEKGTIFVRDIDCTDCKAESENGKIEIKNSTFETLTISSETGSISLENLTIDKRASVNNENGNLMIADVFGNSFDASTEKGNITAYCSFKKSRLATELGSIKFRSISSKSQYSTLASELGSIVIVVDDETLPWMITANVERGSIKNKTSLKMRSGEVSTIFESPEWDNSKDPIVVMASTELGSISVRNG